MSLRRVIKEYQYCIECGEFSLLCPGCELWHIIACYVDLGDSVVLVSIFSRKDEEVTLGGAIFNIKPEKWYRLIRELKLKSKNQENMPFAINKETLRILPEEDFRRLMKLLRDASHTRAIEKVLALR